VEKKKHKHARTRERTRGNEKKTRQDPEIREMAEQLANDPAFKAMAGQLQKQQEEGKTGQVPGLDPESYTHAMQNLMNNPQFMQVAEKLGSEMMQVRSKDARSQTHHRSIDQSILRGTSNVLHLHPPFHRAAEVEPKKGKKGNHEGNGRSDPGLTDPRNQREKKKQ